MPVKHQAKRLEHLMQRHYGDTMYAVSLPPVEVKRSSIEALKVGDVFPLKADRLECVLLDAKETPCALAIFKDADTLEVTEILPKNEEVGDSAYGTVVFIVGTIAVKTIEKGQMFQGEGLKFDTVAIRSEGDQVAEGSLVWADEMLCILVNEVM